MQKIMRNKLGILKNILAEEAPVSNKEANLRYQYSILKQILRRLNLQNQDKQTNPWFYLEIDLPNEQILFHSSA